MANGGHQGTKVDHFYAIGDKVWKGGAHYRGPGIIVAYFPGLDPQSTLHYIVAHQIAGGDGYFYHIYTSLQLTQMMQLDESRDNR